MSNAGAVFTWEQRAPHSEKVWKALAERLAEPGGVWGLEMILGDAVVFIQTPDSPPDRPAQGTAKSQWSVVGDIRLDARADLISRLGLPLAEGAAWSDVQLVTLAFETWGDAAPGRLLGGFALIAWDHARRQLHLVVDATGEKRLYLHRGPQRIAAATFAAALFAVPEVPRTVNVHALVQFCADLREPWSTTLVGIETIPAGYAVILHENGREERRRWWSPPSPHAWRRGRNGNAGLEFLDVFRTAVGDRLPAGASAGGHCSGGLDSTAVSATAASLLAEGGRRYRTYTAVPHPDWSAGPRSPRWENDERPYVRALARLHPNLDPAFVAVDGTIFLDCLPAHFATTAAWSRNTDNMPWALAIHELMRGDGVVQPLGGGFGNATISLDGDILPDLIAAGRWDLVAGEFRAAPAEFCASLRRMAGSYMPVWMRHALGRRGTVSSSEAWRERIAFRPAAAAAYGANRRHSRPRTFAGILANLATRLQRSGTTLPVLDPTRDRRVIEFCWSLPPTEFRHGYETRRLIRRSMIGLLPDEIRLRTTRGAQAPDVWLHLNRRIADLRDAVEFIARDPLCSELIDIPSLRATLNTWPTTQDPRFADRIIPFNRAVAAGLYLRWINEGLTALPGARPPRPPIVERVSV